MRNPAILMAAEDEGLRHNLKLRFQPNGPELIDVPSRDGVLRFIQMRRPDLVVVESSGRDPHDGLELAESIRNWDRGIPIILITRHSSEERVTAALRIGINDYFKVPFSYDELIASIKRNLSDHSTFPGEDDIDESMIGQGPSMRELKNYLLRAARTDSTVLITGETGTGKELVAELIHRESARHDKPFVCINCAALPETLIESEMFGYERGAFTGAVALSRGKFEQADGGTVFLDEIGDMSPYAQSKILRTIEKKEVHRLGGTKAIPLNVRVTAATNQDPERLVAERKFREDLYYRLNVARVHLPPLRERKEDIPRLIEHSIRELNHRLGREIEGLTSEAMACILQYDWPGNVRELMNLLEAAFINLPSRRIAFMDLPAAFQKRFAETERLPQRERDQVLSALFATNWNKSKAARELRWSRMTLYRKMAKYHIVTKSGS